MQKFRWKRFGAALALVLGGCLAGAGNARADAFIEREGITYPSERRSISFNGPGVLKAVNVKEGQTVEARQLVAAQDDRVEQKELSFYESQAKTTVRIEAAQADLAVKQSDLKRKEKMHDQDVLSDEELEKARLEVVFGEASVKLAQQEQLEKQLQVQVQQAKIELKQLLSPIDGVVQKLDYRAGEVADPSKQVMTIVRNDPLWVEANVPTGLAKTLREGQAMDVRYTDEEKFAPAKIIFIGPVADATSDTRLIRMEMANPQKKESGLQVRVRLPDTLAAAQPQQ